MREELDRSLLKKLAHIVSREAGVRFTEKHLPMIGSRIKIRMMRIKTTNLNSYFTYLEKHYNEEIVQLVSLLTTHHTYFYRESVHFHALRDIYLPNLAKNGTHNITVWSSACSKGHEPYSIAMEIEEFLARNRLNFSYRIYGTDIDSNCINFAKNGVYPKRDLIKLPDGWSDKYFSRGRGEISDYYRINNKIRSNCEFLQHNMIRGGNLIAEKFDLIFCRNLFIYFSEDQIEKSMQILINQLKDNGRIFLGITEQVDIENLPLYPESNSVYRLAKNQVGLDAQPCSYGTEVKQSHISDSYQNETKSDEKDSDHVNLLIVEDSRTIVEYLKMLISNQSKINLIGVAYNTKQAEEFLRSSNVDIMTLDINLPGENGVSFLKRIYPKYGIPTIVVSSLNKMNSNLIWDALDCGAIDYVEKPGKDNFNNIKEELLQKIMNSSNQQFHFKTSNRELKRNLHSKIGKRLVLIGSSTGGTVALKTILKLLPSNIPPILVVQHIPEGFSASFAARLDSELPFIVKEATKHDLVLPNQVLIAPGNKQMTIIQDKSNDLKVHISDKDVQLVHNPSVDVLFNSAAKIHGLEIDAYLLTGMGSDGAKGMAKLREMGASTMVQSEESCVIFGMPRVALELNAAHRIGGLEEISKCICHGIKSIQ